MAFEIPVVVMTFVAGADLRTKQYHFVKITGVKTVNVCDAVTDCPIGVLQNKPNIGETAEVMVIGVTKLSADAQIAALPAFIGTSADGQGAAYVPGVDTTKYIVGQALETAGAASVLFSVFINCGFVARGA